jgi:hypothetical protein
MATRSTITAKLSNGTWKSVYCHFDGHINRNGLILFACYNTQERVDALLEHGNMSQLGRRCDKPEGHTYAKPADGCTVYYGRDRGDLCENGWTDATEAEARRDTEEYNYTWDGQRWTVAVESEIVPLVDALVAKGFDMKVLEAAK